MYLQGLRRKRSIQYNKVHHGMNPFLNGEPLRTVVKKDGKHLW